MMISGPLGIWKFPLLNLLREIVQANKKVLPQKKNSTYSNLEEYEISEKDTGEIMIKVHRKAKRE